MDKITLELMTRELCHKYFMKFQYDPDIFEDVGEFRKYQYDKEKVDTYFESQQKPNRLVFMVMKSGEPIGEVKLKDIDQKAKECTLGIHMKNDFYKGRGYGTAAERLAVKYAFDQLGMDAVNADIVRKNRRSQHVIQKVGFDYVRTEGIFKYYRIQRSVSMELSKMSSVYKVRKMKEADIDKIYELSIGNPLFFKYCPPAVTKESIKNDMNALPPNKTKKDKYYIGYFDGEELVAVMDLIIEYPNKKTAFIGLFMMNNKYQGKGNGSAIIKEFAEYSKSLGFSRIRLGIAKGNPQSEHFWMKNGFVPTGVELDMEEYVAIFMERKL